MPAAVRLRIVVGAAVVASVLSACSGGSGTDASSTASSSTRAAPSVTTPAAIRVAVTSEQDVDRAYRQGLARTTDGWVFSTNFSLFRTDDELNRVVTVDAAIPSEWVARGYDHIGDVDVVGDVVVVPLEQPDYGAGRQAMLRFDVETLGYLDGVEVEQSHNSWVAVDPETMTAYSTSGFTDDRVLRYDIEAGWAPLEPIVLDATIDRIQGGDLLDGALWLSTDDEVDGVYHVDLATGAVTPAGSIGHVESEGEGIDATTLPSGTLHVLTAGAALGPVLLVHLDPVDAGGGPREGG